MSHLAQTGPQAPSLSQRLKSALKATFVGQIGSRLRNGPGFKGSSNYWEHRYGAGGNSGVGSYGDFATFKAEILNEFVKEKGIGTVIEFGCGDGNQLQYANYPTYVGVDISTSAVNKCQELYKEDVNKTFLVYEAGRSYGKHDLALSLDVIFHLVEDDVFNAYMSSLFSASDRFTIIYSSNSLDLNTQHQWPPHIRHRQFTDWIVANRSERKLIQHIPNRFPFSRSDAGEERGSVADFFIYERVDRGA